MGVVLVILLPVGFLLAAAWFIWRRLYHASIPQRRAAFILQEDPEVIQVLRFDWCNANNCIKWLLVAAVCTDWVFTGGFSV